ncbi:MAG TPA: hypothetical protein VFG69_14060 [Nannocystaceae bacterium]|nr:hypothetical protein [Nannocystaceae bacterium]
MAAWCPRGILAFALLAAAGCAGKSGASGRTQAPQAEARGKAAEADDPHEVLSAAEVALEQEKAAEAVALFGRALAAGLDGDDDLRRAWLGLAGAHELLHDCNGVLRATEAYLERFAGASDRVQMVARRGACEAELGRWEASATSFAEVAAAPDQLPSTRIEALARQGYALFELDQWDDADRVLARADEVFEAAERDQSERFSSYYFVGMARFYRAAILHRKFRDVAIVLPETVMAERFKRKLDLLVKAQDAYNHTIKAKHMFWVSASGYQLGHLFGEFYDALMYAPVPDWLDERQRRIYYEELKTQIRPVVDKAVWVLEKNLETARRLGYESEFVAQTEAKLSHLKQVLVSDEAGLGKPHPRLVAEETAAVGPPIETGTQAPADRKLFVPPMTPLAP